MGLRALGRWTIEGAETSQFENHLRAVVGLPFRATTALGHVTLRAPDAAGRDAALARLRAVVPDAMR
jgi:5-(carboxyamino)imidazole ribonucleotide synthase